MNPRTTVSFLEGAERSAPAGMSWPWPYCFFFFKAVVRDSVHVKPLHSDLATVPGGRIVGQLPKPLKAHLLIPSAAWAGQGCSLGGSQLELRFPKQLSIQGLCTPRHQTLHKVLGARILFTSLK